MCTSMYAFMSTHECKSICVYTHANIHEHFSGFYAFNVSTHTGMSIYTPAQFHNFLCTFLQTPDVHFKGYCTCLLAYVYYTHMRASMSAHTCLHTRTNTFPCACAHMHVFFQALTCALYTTCFLYLQSSSKNTALTVAEKMPSRLSKHSVGAQHGRLLGCGLGKHQLGSLGKTKEVTNVASSTAFMCAMTPISMFQYFQ
jgi:hypothetical protein